MQVYLSSVPLAEFAAAVTDQDDSQLDHGHEAVAVGSPASDLKAGTTVGAEVTNSFDVDGNVQQQSAGDVSLHEQEDSYMEESDAQSYNGPPFTLIVRKGQQLQELEVDGIISQEELKREVEQIVSFLLATEEAAADVG